VSDRLFVYGTLRSDAGHPMRKVLAQGARHRGAGWVHGTLVVVDWYPGLVTAPPPARVFGELWEVSDAGIWAPLDQYEGCGPRDPSPHEYQRATLRVTSEELGEVDAWAYLYAAPVDGLAVIESGDWLDHAHPGRR
jgi:gamma-glutamylcyclotransferase (GGCT)/AIG2-like uncharacterized protein YtfP